MHWDNTKSGAGSPPSLGNLTTSNSQVLTRAYNGFGSLTDIYSPEVRTHVTYGPHPSDPDNPGPYPTGIDYAYGSPFQRSWTYSWGNYYRGALASKTDDNNNLTTSYGFDALNRSTDVDEAGIRKTHATYDDVNRMVTVSKDLRTYGDGDLESITSYDMLGRVTQVQTSDGVTLSGSNGINVETSYANVSGGHWVVTSTPYRTTGDHPTLEWTCTLYDVMNRVTSVAMYTGTAAPTDCTSATSRTGNTVTSYDINSTGAVTTTTDPAGKARSQYIDGLKRLTKVIEDPGGHNYETDYAYDVLDNLKTVTQGSQTRTAR